MSFCCSAFQRRSKKFRLRGNLTGFDRLSNGTVPCCEWSICCCGLELESPRVAYTCVDGGIVVVVVVVVAAFVSGSCRSLVEVVYRSATGL